MLPTSHYGGTTLTPVGRRLGNVTSMMLGVPRLLPQRRPCPRWRLRERRQGHLSVDKFPLPVDVVHVVEVLHGGVPHTLVGVRVHSQGITAHDRGALPSPLYHHVGHHMLGAREAELPIKFDGRLR